MKKGNSSNKNGRPLKHNQEDEAAYRKAAFFEHFKAEAPYIRDEILRELPAFNMLLSMQSESFDDIALRVIAKQRGIPYDPLNPPVPDCPVCKQHDSVGSKGTQGYYCNRCKKSFRACHNSIVSDKKISDLLFIRVVTAILEGYGQTKTCDLTGVTPTTFFRIRNKVFYALQLMLENVSIYGVVQADCCFARVSYKGLDLQERDFDENSLFYDKTAFIPRESRKRGGPLPLAERNANSLCILSLIDEYGKSRNIMCGTGLASVKTFKMFIPNELIQTKVPEHESFTLLKDIKRDTERKPGEPSLLVIDGELALESYAKYLGVEYESHVYRKNGVQRALPEGAHDIQRINALHSRLKKFLRASPISSKYLPGYLLLFDVLDMTGGSEEAKKQVLEIMATPGLGQKPEFFQQLFTVPNYLEQWFAGEHPLKKLPYHQLLAFYLYDHVRNKDAYPGIEVTMQYIRQACGYSDKHIRASYQNLLNAGYRDMILEYFGESARANSTSSKQMANIPPIIPILHEEWAAYVRGENGPRPSFKKFAQMKIEQHKLSFTVQQLKYRFQQVEKLGICSRIPPREDWVSAAPNIPQDILALYDEWSERIRKDCMRYPSLASFYREKVKESHLGISYASLRQHFDNIQALKLREPLRESKKYLNSPSARQIEIFNDYEELRKGQAQLSKNGLISLEIREQLGEKYSLSPHTIVKYIRNVRNHQKGCAIDEIAEASVVYEKTSGANLPSSKAKAGTQTLFQFNPAAAARWHPTKNGSLTPNDVTYGSSKRVWWLCSECGNEWKSAIRVQSRKLKCPKCQEVVEDSLAENTHLSAQWHPTKNGNKTPYNFRRMSAKKVWWLCEQGHEWEASIIERSQGNGCPICSNRRVLQGYNDLASRFPAVAAQWHPTKNGELTPAQVTYGSGRRVWWLCSVCGNEWETTINNRTQYKSGCKRCSTHKTRSSTTDANLALLRPDLAAQWHPTKNGSLSPTDITLGVGKKVWWVCERGHEWEAYVPNRVKGSGCPHCTRQKRSDAKTPNGV